MRLPLHNHQHHHIFTRPPHSPYIPKPMAISLSSSSHRLFTNISPPLLTIPTNRLPLPAARSRLLCRTKDSEPCYADPLITYWGVQGLALIFHYQLLVATWFTDAYMEKDFLNMMSQLELGKSEEKRKPQKGVNGIFWILLLNLGVYVADHFFQVRGIKALYLYHNRPMWYQFVTSTFCHANWNHLSSNLFFLYIFGKLVEEEEGNFALWLSYILTGAGANLVSWLVLPTNAVSVGASGAVFGLFAVSVLVKMSWDWRKILEMLILGQFVVEKVMEAAQASTGLSGSFRGGYALQNVNHIAHLSGALIGVLLVWLVSRIPHQPSDQEIPSRRKKTG